MIDINNIRTVEVRGVRSKTTGDNVWRVGIITKDEQIFFIGDFDCYHKAREFASQIVAASPQNLVRRGFDYEDY